MNVSRETSERLASFSEFVLKWTKAINLIAKNTEATLWERHIADSLQIYKLAGPGRRWVDLGSGGGFPGLVIAIAAYEKDPNRETILVESDARKATFLREAARHVGVDVTVLNSRIEAVNPLAADVLSARALAPLDKLMEYTHQHRSSDGISLFPKGRRHQEEIADARKTWQFDPIVHQSTTDAEAVIVEIRSLSRV